MSYHFGYRGAANFVTPEPRLALECKTVSDSKTQRICTVDTELFMQIPASERVVQIQSLMLVARSEGFTRLIVRGEDGANLASLSDDPAPGPPQTP